MDVAFSLQKVHEKSVISAGQKPVRGPRSDQNPAYLLYISDDTTQVIYIIYRGFNKTFLRIPEHEPITNSWIHGHNVMSGLTSASHELQHVFFVSLEIQAVIPLEVFTVF